MPRDTLAMRRRQGAVVSLMLLKIVRRFHSIYASITLPEMMCVWAIHINDERTGTPCSLNRLAKITRLPRASVKRYLEELIAHGLVEKTNHGYIGRDDWLMHRPGASHWERVMQDIKSCSTMLNKLR